MQRGCDDIKQSLYPATHQRMGELVHTRTNEDVYQNQSSNERGNEMIPLRMGNRFMHLSQTREGWIYTLSKCTPDVREQVERYVLGMQQLRKLDEEEQVVLEVLRELSRRGLSGSDSTAA
mgnify:CR=1 FL=1